MTVLAVRPEQPLDATAQVAARERSVAASARAGILLRDRDGGRLGGWFGCGSRARAAGTVCVGIDAGALVSVAVEGTGPDAEGRARMVRETVARRGTAGASA